METANRRLMWHGMFLFLLGLITGFLEQHFTNVRMGLAAHLEGVMNGIFLLALGAIWTQVQLPRAAKGAAYWTALYGTYVNWLVTTLEPWTQYTAGPGNHFTRSGYEAHREPAFSSWRRYRPGLADDKFTSTTSDVIPCWVLAIPVVENNTLSSEPEMRTP